MSQTTVFCRFQLPGVHRWENAPEKYFYLRPVHRHIFYFEVRARVMHGDREIEFIAFADECRHLLGDNFSTCGWLLGHLDFGGFSCESIAAWLYSQLERAGYDLENVTVSEDNENGAIYTGS